MKEKFGFLNVTFDVAEAKKIINTKKIPLTKIKVNSWTHFFAKKEPGVVSLGVNVDDIRAEKLTDEQKEAPGIVVQYKHQRVKRTLLIDGFHRLRRKELDGDEWMEVYLMNSRQTKKIMSREE